MNQSAILPIIALILTMILGVVVFWQNPKQLKNRILSGLIFFIFVWIFSVMMADQTHSYDQALWWSRASIIGPSFFPFLFLWFSYVFPREVVKLKLSSLFFYFIPVLLILVFSPTALNVKEIKIVDWGTDFTPGPLYYFIFVYLLIYMGLAFARLLKNYKSLKGIEKYQVKYLFLGALLFLILGIFANLILPIIGFTQSSVVGPSTSLVFISFVAYAMSRYRFMDIRIVFQKILNLVAVALFAYLAFYAIVLVEEKAFGGVFNKQAYVIGIPLAIIFSAIFFPLQKFFQQLTTHYIFAELFNYQTTIGNLSNQLTGIIDLNQIINLVVDNIKQAMRLDRAGVLLAEHGSDPVKYKIAKVIGFNEQNGISLVQDNLLTDTLAKTKKLLVKEELDLLSESATSIKKKAGFRKLRENMDKIEASLCLPLINAKQLNGIIVLGAKTSGDAYTKEDLDLLSVLANQAATAIANAKLYKEVQEFNQTLQSKVDEQTQLIKQRAEHMVKLVQMRSEFLDVASHQLRTPTSVIKGTLAMMKEGDFDSAPEEQKKKLIEGMYQKSVKLEEIINDILLASEMDTGEENFELTEKININDLVEKIVKQHELDFINKNLQLNWSSSNEKFIILTNSRYLEEAINNLLDNAIKYTTSGSISLSLEKIDQVVRLMIKDTGIGIPQEDQANLFKKFVRAKNARNAYTDGSGLGLFIVKEVVDKHPGAKVWFESQENSGTVFYLEFNLLS